MSGTETTRAAATYAIAWTVAAAVGAVVAGIGVVQWLLPAYARYLGGDPAVTVLRNAAPGLVLLLLGVLVWKVASALVLYRTLATAAAADTAERLDTEAMKSDILSVMDERLADMKRDTQRTRRVVESERSEEATDEFEFPEER